MVAVEPTKKAFKLDPISSLNVLVDVTYRSE